MSLRFYKSELQRLNNVATTRLVLSSSVKWQASATKQDEIA